MPVRGDRLLVNGCHSTSTSNFNSSQPPEAAVTLSIAKRPGANAIDVVNAILDKVDTLKGRLLPSDVQIAVTTPGVTSSAADGHARDCPGERTPRRGA